MNSLYVLRCHGFIDVFLFMRLSKDTKYFIISILRIGVFYSPSNHIERFIIDRLY